MRIPFTLLWSWKMDSNRCSNFSSCSANLLLSATPENPRLWNWSSDPNVLSKKYHHEFQFFKEVWEHITTHTKPLVPQVSVYCNWKFMSFKSAKALSEQWHICAFSNVLVGGVISVQWCWKEVPERFSIRSVTLESLAFVPVTNTKSTSRGAYPVIWAKQIYSAEWQTISPMHNIQVCIFSHVGLDNHVQKLRSFHCKTWTTPMFDDLSKLLGSSNRPCVLACKQQLRYKNYYFVHGGLQQNQSRRELHR